MYPRYPGNRRWCAFKQVRVKLPQMTPQEFLSYWDVTYSELAEICFCSERTVNRWFAGLQQPTVIHKFWLASTHNMWVRL